MSNQLVDFYDRVNCPYKDRIMSEKNILIILPKKDYDFSKFLFRLGISKYEVAITYPKKNISLIAEVTAAKPLLVVQVDCCFSKKWQVVKSDGDWDKSFEDRVRSVAVDRFVSLHHHDEFSIKDGLGTVEQLIKILKSQRRSFCCVTNHGSVGGWIRQYNACRQAGIKPIFGMEAYVKKERVKERSANHLIMLANNQQGFENIIKIHNDAQVNGFYYDPRANWASIEKWGSGIIGTSACFAGEIPRILMDDELSVDDRFSKAKDVYDFYSKSFDDFFIELQIIEFESQKELNHRLIDFCEKIGGRYVLACDSHYLEPEQAETHDLLMMSRQGKTILDKQDNKADVWNFEVRNLYYRNAEQMSDTFVNGFDEQEFTETGSRTVYREPMLNDIFTQEIFDSAMKNTHLIAKNTEDIWLDSSIKLPQLYDDSKEILRNKVNDGFEKRGLWELSNSQEYIDRLIHELKIIFNLGWSDYFLVMEYIINWTYENFGEWAVGYGRGSAAGSLVAYCLRLTDIDPVKYNLLFERFLDEGRPDPPDIDTDFDPRIRDEVKKHIIEKFGENNTCSIGTYQTYKTKAVIVDVARVLGLDVHEANNVTKNIDSLQSFEDDSGDEKRIDNMSLDDIESHYQELESYFNCFPEVKVHSNVLRNQVRNMGKHAGGVIISDLNLKGKIPIQLDSNGDIISSWAESGNAAELSKVGLVKYDLLGLNNLPIISDCIDLVKKNRGIDIKRNDIPIDDRESIYLGAKGDLVGIFQFENPSTREIVDKVRMESLEDVSAITSLLRPGPKDMGMHLEYARRKHGGEYEMPNFMRECLKDTYGIVTYQEQCMNISRLLSGFNGSEANKLRKAIGKKQEDLMLQMKDKFILGAKKRVDNGEITENEVLDVWNQLEAFAGYGFNRSHAVAYSAITTVQLWLKYNYTIEYITALLNNTKQGKKKLSIGVENLLVYYLNYSRKKGYEILPPCINKSSIGFEIDSNEIRFSLGHIKNVASAADKIPCHAPYTSMSDFYNRCVYEQEIKTGKNAGKMRKSRPNKKVVESLIAAGAFDDLAKDGKSVQEKRNSLLEEYYSVKSGKKETPNFLAGDKWKDKEVEMLGICLSEPPLHKTFSNKIIENRWDTIDSVGSKERAVIFGKIISCRAHTSKKGNNMHLVTIFDGYDSLTFFVFEKDKFSFFDNYKVGNIVGIPLRKFSDGDARFFDSYSKNGRVVA